ncbi:hypothetical protein COY26_02250 [Candidatus Woesearchaeota archaeon CG_4_10_14_0_2_um_filter_33_10]|nr:MAG: hypothetical protein COV14_01390 [Candidatus Woesearchaeota archaeon CG10_big_fil_rev_8_21_14_0_10_33_12]PIU72519.1 MAG: hypothetical protein COS79_02570 [Candidatus Woesearchaeota archaeon CG06_land_8_20_14_3_00_33_13]PIZ53358.1 MAG: hypothetical protein COY26_02250 [Candidatus Woesearchaeota archaeon CG_4_10_14_0_2_um_filter_33_10]
MKAIILLSPGIDSPVAACLMEEKGLELIGLNFFMDNHNAVDKIAKKLGIKKVHYINHKEILTQIKNNTNPKYTCLLCKRVMYRIAENLAKKEKAEFIVTGENLGQVASQTLDNLAVLDESIKTNVLRPLLCFDKNEIINIAKKINTYELSENKKCLFVPGHPATKAKLEIIKKEELKINLYKMVSEDI